MNDNAGDRRGLRLRRAGPVTAAAAGIALLAAACGGSSTTGAGGSGGATYAKALAYAKCMRSHGLPQFPAPDAQGNFPGAYITPGDQAQEQKADQACSSLLPPEGTGLSAMQLQALQQEHLKNAVKASRCMRAHGIEGFPDPAAGPPGSTVDGGVNWQPVQSALQAGSFSTSTPSYEAAYHACPGNIPPPFWPGASGFGGPVLP